MAGFGADLLEKRLQGQRQEGEITLGLSGRLEGRRGMQILGAV